MSKKVIYTKAEVEEKEGGQIEVVVEVPWEEVVAHRESVINSLSEEVSIKGFRKGKVPEKKLVEHVGDDRIREEMARHAIDEAYQEVILEKNLDLLGRPNITITKLAEGNALEFSIKGYVMPDIDLPEYKKIAKSVERKEVEVSDKDVKDAIETIRSQWAKSEKYEKAREAADDPSQVNPQEITVEDKDLPELTDEFASKLGDFKNIKDFKEKLRGNLKQEKEMREQERFRIEILEKIREGTTVEIPEILIEQELSKMEQKFEADVQRAGFEMDDYLKQVGKSHEDITKEWRPDAKKRIQTELILQEIAEKEDIEAEDEKIKGEVQKIMAQHEDADPLQAAIYVRSVLTNQKVVEFLENLSK